MQKADSADSRKGDASAPGSATSPSYSKKMKAFLAGISLIALAFSSPAPAQSQPGENVVALFVRAAIERTGHRVIYDGRYRSVDYPGGDVPDTVGVCTDVVIRSYRKVGIDLQKLVHEDMREHFDAYPDIWGLTRPDTNIDHRRVPNLQVFFKRQGVELPVTPHPDDYRAGDVVTWMVAGNLPHIGIVTDKKSTGGGRPLIVHNIGRGPQLEDMLFTYPITGHYRYPR